MIETSQLEEYLFQRKDVFSWKSDIPLSDEILRSLRNDEKNTISEDMAIQALNSIEWDYVSCQLLAQQGTFHTVFRVIQNNSVHILRVSKLSALTDVALYVEENVLVALAKHHISHAAIDVIDCSRQSVPFDFGVCDYLQGESLTAKDCDDADIMPFIPVVARYLKSVHAIHGKGFGFIYPEKQERLCGINGDWFDFLGCHLERHLSILLDTGDVNVAESKEVLCYMDRAKTELGRVQSHLLHGDCGNHNMIVKKSNEVVLIDWEDALLGDPLFDVALWATFHPERRWPTFFNAYFERDWQPTFEFWMYYTRIALSKTVHRLRFGYVDPADRPKASLRIQRGLEGLRMCS